MNNWLIFIVGILQVLGALHYFHEGMHHYGWLYAAYGFTNFVIYDMGRA